MSELREAAKAALTAYEKFRDVDDIDGLDDAMDRLRAALAQPEPEAPRDEWRPASEPPEDDRSVLVWMPGKLGGLAIGRCSRGNWSPYYLGSPVTHWRDVTPPTESTIAAKCQRVEGSGEICGLTPPCPDCGSSLIDVADGSL